jgi:FAD/FMN-containing dehydrogenase
VSLKKKLEAIVGPENVLTRQDELERYAKDQSIFEGLIPSCLVRPLNADEIRKLLRLANEEKIPVIPVSSGLHFNGISLPAQGGMILDMGRMNRIIEVDLRNRRAMIEPGVKWGQLQEHLKNLGMVAMNPLFPHPEQSVMTSYLERQPLLIPRFEYAEPISTLEVVLPTGDLLRTGSAASPGAPFDTVADMVCPYGPGLDFFRLFQGAQGTLGAVTWMNVKIEYLSPLRRIYIVQSEALPDLLSFVHQVQRLMIGNECFILKRPDAAAIASDGDRALMEKLLQQVKKWTAFIQIAGARWRPDERIEYQEKALMNLCAELGMRTRDSLTPSRSESDLFEDRLQMPWKEGKPYWKYLRLGKCHDIAFHTTFGRLPRLLEEAAAALEKEGFQDDSYGVYIQPLEYGRAYYSRIHLYHNAENGSRIKQIMVLDRELNRRLLLSGALFNTPYGAQASLTYDHAAMYTETLKKVKKIFDPVGVMNPGRLCF